MLAPRLISKTGTLFTTLFLFGCGGSHHGSGVDSAFTEPYPGFGYSENLYVGNYATTGLNGTHYSGKVALTASADGASIHGYNSDSDELDAFILRTPEGVTGISLPVGAEMVKDPITFVVSGRKLHIAYQATNGVSGTVDATLDVPKLTPARPPAGSYAGKDFLRGSVNGVLFSVQAAIGTVAADGTFDFTYGERGSGAGELKGLIRVDGSVAVTALISGGNVLDASSQTVTAYGTGSDFTLVLRDPVADTIGVTYRLHRTGS